VSQRCGVLVREKGKLYVSRLIKNPFIDLDYEAEDFISEEVLEIYRWIDRSLVDRDDESNVLRASAASLCVLRRWLQGRGIKGNRTAPRSILNFMLGELFEHAIKHLIKYGNVGPGKLYSEVNFGKVIGTFPLQKREFELHEQIEVITKIGPLTIPGHLDGMGKRNIDGKWEFIEAKSSSDYGFEKFKKKGPDDYLRQSHTLMMSEEAAKWGVSETRYFYGRKQKGHLHGRLIRFDDNVADLVRREFLQSVSGEKPRPPHSLAREIDSGGFPTGRVVALVVPCSYCPYLNTEHCHNGLTKYLRRDFRGNRKPLYAKPARAIVPPGGGQ
jgi:hypothetical protein